MRLCICAASIAPWEWRPRYIRRRRGRIVNSQLCSGRSPSNILWKSPGTFIRSYDDVSFETSVETSENPVLSWWDLQPQLPDARYRLFNAGNYFPILDIRSNLPEERGFARDIPSLKL